MSTSLSCERESETVAVALSLHRLLRRGDAAALIDAFERSMLALLLLLMTAAVAGGIGPGRLATLGGGPNVFGRNMGLLCVFGLDRAMRGSAKAVRGRPSASSTPTSPARPRIDCAAGSVTATQSRRRVRRLDCRRRTPRERS